MGVTRTMRRGLVRAQYGKGALPSKRSRKAKLFWPNGNRRKRAEKPAPDTPPKEGPELPGFMAALTGLAKRLRPPKPGEAKPEEV